MKPGFPWHVKGVRQRARETAREAARRSGLSVGEWLDSLIIESAVGETVTPPRQAPFEADRRPEPHSSAKVPGFDDPPRKRRPIGYNARDTLVATAQFSKVSNKLDSLARDLDERERRTAQAEISAVNSRLDTIARQLEQRLPARISEAANLGFRGRSAAPAQQVDPKPPSRDECDDEQRHNRAPEGDLGEVKERLETLALTLDQRQTKALETGLTAVKTHIETLAQTLDQRQSQMLDQGLSGVRERLDRLASQLEQQQQQRVPDEHLSAVNERLDMLVLAVDQIARGSVPDATQADPARLAKQQRQIAEAELAAVKERLDTLALQLDQRQGRGGDESLELVRGRLETLSAQLDQQHQTRQPDKDLAAVNDRLDTLVNAIDQLARANAGAERSPERPADDTSRQLTEAIARLDMRLDQLIVEGRSATSEIEQRVGAVDRAVAELNRAGRQPIPTDPATPLDQALIEIAERQRMLDSEVFSRASTQDLAELRQQLRGITSQIETIRPCGVDTAVETLRNDLAEIGVMIREAMPRKAIEALEIEVRSLSQKIDEGRQYGASAADIAGLERGLTEVRDTLRGLTPAESLVGLEEAVTVLSRKIDTISVSHQDPATLDQLESAIAALRGIVSHVASNDALAKLGEDVRVLGAKIDHVGAVDAFTSLDQRITAIADALQSHNQTGQETQALASVIEGLADKLERLQLTRADQTEVGHLEDRIVKLVEKLDACDGRLVHLETIERGLAELLIHLEHQRLPALTRTGAEAEAASPQRDDKSTQESLEAMHATLDHLVDRLEMIESGLRNQGLPKAAAAPPIVPASTEPEASQRNPILQPEVPPPPAESPRPAVVSRPEPKSSPAAVSSLEPAAPTVASLVPAAAVQPALGNPSPATERERRPIDPNLPPDHPLEPGLATRIRGNSPADRIAASEAALGKPPVIPDPGGKSNFIAAARRAAKAALAEAPVRGDKTVPFNVAAAKAAAPASAQASSAQASSTQASSTQASFASRMGKRARTLLLATSVVLIVLGSLHFAVNLLGSSEDAGNASAPAAPEPLPLPLPLPQRSEEPTAPALPTPGRQSTIVPSAPELTFGVPGMGSAPPAPVRPATTAPAQPTSPALTADSVTTGSVRQIEGPASDVQRPGTDRPPAGPGNTVLRVAAAKGDAAAEYEMGVRSAEGRGLPQDFAAAAEWFERAGNQGLIPAQFRLGGLYEKGLGVKRDLDKARRLYVAAAEAGNAKAMHNLAVLHAEGGLEGKPDFPTAAKWFRKAAEHGITDSQYNLGILYARGIGIETNLLESYKWFALAAREGDKDSAKKRDEIGAKIDQQSLMSLRAVTQVWTPAPQPPAAVDVKVPVGGWDAAAVSAPAPAPRRVGPKSERAETAPRPAQ